jgi:CO/xanthine dehydrogenase Mo-binding subunit
MSDATLLSSWIEIRPDNTAAIRTGVSEFGQGTVGTGFRQIAAEELRLPFAAVTEMVTGDTDRTPDGGISAGVANRAVHELFWGSSGIHPDSPFGRSALNVHKVSAYAYAELLERASNILGAPAETLTVADGAFRSATGTVTYAELVRDSPLETRLEIQGTADGPGVVVLGTPPVVPVSEYRVIGTSCPSPRIAQIASGTASWAGDVRVPGMVHARVVHPRTLGSTLLKVGTLPDAEFPGAELIVVGNLVGVVSPDEWEAIRAARALEESTEWSDWRGLPGSDGLIEALLELDWMPGEGAEPDESAEVDAALASAPQTLSAFFTLPYYKHAPISPEVAVADVRADGSVRVWTASQNPRSLRKKVAAMLETELENVVVHFADGAGGFGRSNKGDGGAEGEAVLLSRACGRPVRLQWMREEDFAWSTQQAAYVGEVTLGLDDAGRMTAMKAEHRQPGINQEPLLGALLAGLPGLPKDPAGLYLGRVFEEWPYDRAASCNQATYNAENLGEAASPLAAGLRHRSMRSPQHFQQNFAVESLVNEAAAAAGTDPISYRIEHTTDSRLIRVLEAVRDLSGWETRPSPSPNARAAGDGVVRGRGVGATVRHGGYFAGVAEIEIDLESGNVVMSRYWVVADCGLVVNPTLLRLNIEGGSAMGISQALHEELKFDRSAVTSTDFRSYPILTMAEMPEIEVEIIDRRDVLEVGQGSEPPNMVPPVALAGAFFDATGRTIRRLPLRPEIVRAELLGD